MNIIRKKNLVKSVILEGKSERKSETVGKNRQIAEYAKKID